MEKNYLFFVNDQAELRKSYYHSQGQGTRETAVPFPSSEPPRKSLGKLQIISNFSSHSLGCGGAAKTYINSLSPRASSGLFSTFTPMIILVNAQQDNSILD